MPEPPVPPRVAALLARLERVKGDYPLFLLACDLENELVALKAHVNEFPYALENDLETGSHDSNNRAHEEYGRRHPRVMEWVKKLFDLA